MLDDRSRYRAVCLKIWADEKFQSASDDVQLVWFHLFTNPLNATGIGAYEASIDGLAANKNRNDQWPTERYRKAFQQCVELGFIEYDAKALVVSFPKFFQHAPNWPRNPNIVRFWGKAWRDLPPCALKDQCREKIEQLLKTLPKSFKKAFMQSFPEQIVEYFEEAPSSLTLSSPPLSLSLDTQEYKTKNKKKTEEEIKNEVEEVMNFLNQTGGKHFDIYNGHGKRSPGSEKLAARLREGASVQLCKAIIARKWREWKDDLKMRTYFRPITLFNAEKFDQYRGEVPKEVR